MAWGENSAVRKALSFLHRRKSVRANLAAMTILLCCVLPSAAQSITAGKPDPRIEEALKRVSAGRIRQTIEKLVSFGNRSTLSAQDEESIKASKGIGAARE